MTIQDYRQALDASAAAADAISQANLLGTATQELIADWIAKRSKATAIYNELREAEEHDDDAFPEQSWEEFLDGNDYHKPGQ